MKRIFYLILLLFTFLCIGCNRKPTIDGELKNPVMSGIYIYITDLHNNYCKEIDNKFIYELNNNETYKISVLVQYSGSSQDAHAYGDIANFIYDEDECNIQYIGTEKTDPLYELLVKGKKEFHIDIAVKEFSLTATIIPVMAKE